jgi:protein-tyrosine phosphatase
MPRVLFVCTANICRSPLAQRLFAARLPTEARIETGSAGIRALSGQPMDALAAAVLRDLGGDPAGHAAAQLTPELVDNADLILTATSAHRAEILRAQPGAMRRTFTLREFARLATSAPRQPNGPLSERIADVAAQRGLATPRPGADEIGDPFGAPLPIVAQCGRQISDAIDSVLRVVAPARG